MKVLPVTSVQVADTEEFIYQPPAKATNASRILVKPNLGYPVAPPVTVSINILKKVLQGLRQVSPNGEILIVEGVCSPVSLEEIAHRHGLYGILDEGMQLLDADKLPMSEYPNLSPSPVRYKSMFAPTMLQEVDCCITVGAFKKTNLKGKELISASLKNLYGLFPRSRYKARSSHSRGQLHRPSVPLILQDVYFSIGYLFAGAVVDGDLRFVSDDWRPDKGKTFPFGKIFFGDDILAVDRRACELAKETVPDYLDTIENLRQLSNI
ncbi:DUF362 domain-containing protein [Calothrix sp. 336/3]|uniref:DUF362 domain-containing protein n=1 Tax=Calothrix sp. 336/3 TaxID=1337936 RepID=UPI0004E350FB|nr:DUF362 domain-containing protein [Calothrix sp. 336/3]AKG22746.1 hypothetical protein IJ00_17005 [Calothrix sp. 336/3]